MTFAGDGGSMAVWYSRLDARGADLTLGFARTGQPDPPRPRTGHGPTPAQGTNVTGDRHSLHREVGGERRFVNRPTAARAPRRTDRRPITPGPCSVTVFERPARRLHLPPLSAAPPECSSSRFRIVDVARQGRRGRQRRDQRSWVLLLARSSDDTTRCYLRSKRPKQSVLERYPRPSEHGRTTRPTRGRRSTADAGGQRCAARAGTAPRGSSTAPTRDYYVRQLWDHKGGDRPGHPLSRHSPQSLYGSPAVPGHWPAPTPAPATPIAISTYLGAAAGFDEAMVDYAERYATQNANDHADLLTALGTRGHDIIRFASRRAGRTDVG